MTMAAEMPDGASEAHQGFFSRKRWSRLTQYSAAFTLFLVVLALIVALNQKDNTKDDALERAAKAEQIASNAQKQLADLQFSLTCYSGASRQANLAILSLLSLYRSQPTPDQANAAYQAVVDAKQAVEATATECGDPTPGSTTSTTSGG